MEAIVLVEHLKELTDNPQNRATIVKDKGCLAGLVLFLDNSDLHVITTALQALKNLAQHKPNRTIMKNELGMLESLRAIMHRNGDTKMKQLASDVYNDLTQEPVTQKAGSSTASHREKPVLRSSARKSRTYIIQVKGLKNQIQKHVCEEQLLTVRGVISFTFDMARSRCIVRARSDCSPEAICTAINKTKALSAQQITKNEHGEEVAVSHNSSNKTLNKSNCKASTTQQKKPVALPDYLPEDEDDTDASKSALARVKRDDDKENQGWFGSVGSFISKTLYW